MDRALQGIYYCLFNILLVNALGEWAVVLFFFFFSEPSTLARWSIFGHGLYLCHLSALTIQTYTLIMFTPQHTLFPQLSSEQEVYRKHRKDGPVVSVLQ